jgi:hypothetical protein
MAGKQPWYGEDRRRLGDPDADDPFDRVATCLLDLGFEPGFGCCNIGLGDQLLVEIVRKASTCALLKPARCSLRMADAVIVVPLATISARQRTPSNATACSQRGPVF